MIEVLRAAERGNTETETVSTWEGGAFRALRAIKEDWIVPSEGIRTHPHRDMEILTYVVDGALEHHDSLGNGAVIGPSVLQRLNAGTGVRHSEHNPSAVVDTHFLQVWIRPDERGMEPSYERRAFPTEERQGRFRLVAARDGRDGALTMHEDLAVYAALLGEGERIRHRLEPGRHAWLQVVRGAVTLNGATLTEGDGAAVSDTRELELSCQSPAELLLFDLA